MYLGIQECTHFVFEGTITSEGRALWPLPVMTPAVIRVANLGKQLQGLPPKNAPLLANTLILFREDFFDPVTRVRRGRFYKQQTMASWMVYPHPALHLEALGAYGTGTIQKMGLTSSVTGTMRIKDMLTFYSYSLWNAIQESRPEIARVELGTRESPTIWRVIDVETISTGEELVTLKARSSFGTLPEFKSDNIRVSDDRSKVVQTIDKLAETIHRAGPESVIDRARDAASAILLAALRQYGSNIKARDLSETIKEIDKHPKLKSHKNISHAAGIVARLHSRAKPSEQERQEHLPPIHEQDAELAVLCIGTILRDLGWAKWV